MSLLDTLNIKTDDGKTVLYWAAWRGREAVVRLLIDYGADINIKTDDGKTALYQAARGGHAAVVQLLKLARAS